MTCEVQTHSGVHRGRYRSNWGREKGHAAYLFKTGSTDQGQIYIALL